MDISTMLNVGQDSARTRIWVKIIMLRVCSNGGGQAGWCSVSMKGEAMIAAIRRA
jgi:hypothetical protein